MNEGSKDVHNVIIIGSGPAGLTAGIYTSRANLNPVLFAGTKFGGQLMNTTVIENYPGFPDGIDGPELMQNFIKQAERFGTNIQYKDVTAVDFSGEIKKVYAGEEEYLAKAVIIATGSSPKKLGLESEEKFWGKGVSTCATCDGAFYRDKVVAVVGGGDSAVEEATFLTRMTSKVYMIHRRDTLRASKIMANRALKNEKIEILWNTEVKDIIGDQTVNKLKLINNQKDEESELEVAGMFLAIGHYPNTEFLNNSLAVDDMGFIGADKHTFTNVEGVFVAGDVHDHHYQQAITAAGMGCMAAIDAEKWLESQGS